VVKIELSKSNEFYWRKSLKLVPRVKVYYGKEELLSAVNLFSKEITREDFERAFAQKFKNKFALFFPYGRVALYSFFKAMKIKNKEIICPAFTCNTVAQAIVLSGNIPVFVDCEENSFNMDIFQIEKVISPRTAAVIAVHMFGYPLDVVTLSEIVEYFQNKFGNKIYIVQDVAQSFGATFKGHLPTLFGDISIFGLGISKIINAIDGGMLTTNDEEIHSRTKEFFLSIAKECNWIRGLKKFIKFLSYFVLLRENFYWIVDLLEKRGSLSSVQKYYREDVIEFPNDWKTIPCNIQSRVGLVQLKKYDKIVELKRENAKHWMEITKNTDIFFFPYNPEATYSRCVGLSPRRDYWIKYFREKGFQLGKVNYLLPRMKAFSKYSKGNYKIAEVYNRQNLIFPS
jgi:perosamine synthetase